MSGPLAGEIFSQNGETVKDGRIFNELSRGDESRQQFFQKIMDVVSFMGGEAADVR